MSELSLNLKQPIESLHTAGAQGKTFLQQVQKTHRGPYPREKLVLFTWGMYQTTLPKIVGLFTASVVLFYAPVQYSLVVNLALGH